MSQARQRILDKLKAEVAGADYSKLPQERGFEYPARDHAQQRALFVQLLEANHAQVLSIHRDDLATAVASELSRRGIRQLMVGDNPDCLSALQGLPKSIALQPFFDSIDGNKDALFNDVPAAITTSKAAIAATGSIVLWPDAAEPRSLSLVPPLHIVIVDEAVLVADFSQLLIEQQWQQGLPSNALLISGPSKTADIQQTLAYGAHGPSELLVLLVATD